MAGQPASFTGYWAATELAPFLVRPIPASVMITASSNPLDLHNFQVMIDQKSGQFNAAAAKAGYSIPVASSAPWAFSEAQRITRDGAVADALRLIYTGPDQKYVDRFEAAFQAALKALAAGDLPLIDASEAGSGAPMPLWKGVSSSVIVPSMGLSLSGRPTDF